MSPAQQLAHGLLRETDDFTFACVAHEDGDHIPLCDRLTAAIEARDAEHEAEWMESLRKVRTVRDGLRQALNGSEADLLAARRDLATARSALDFAEQALYVATEALEEVCAEEYLIEPGNSACAVASKALTRIAALTPATGEST